MTKKDSNIQVSILPTNAGGAIQRMIKISQSLLDLSDRETQALIQNDLLAFAVLQDEKELLADQYTKSSDEFRKRLHEFRSVDKTLIKKLEILQNKLADKAQENNMFVERMKTRAERNTQKTLLTVQELAQSKPVRISQDADHMSANTQQQGA
jgi:hypothetical protein